MNSSQQAALSRNPETLEVARVEHGQRKPYCPDCGAYVGHSKSGGKPQPGKAAETFGWSCEDCSLTLPSSCHGPDAPMFNDSMLGLEVEFRDGEARWVPVPARYVDTDIDRDGEPVPDGGHPLNGPVGRPRRTERFCPRCGSGSVAGAWDCRCRECSHEWSVRSERVERLRADGGGAVTVCVDCGAELRHGAGTRVMEIVETEDGYEEVAAPACRRCALERRGHECEHCGQLHETPVDASECCVGRSTAPDCRECGRRMTVTAAGYDPVSGPEITVIECECCPVGWGRFTSWFLIDDREPCEHMERGRDHPPVSTDGGRSVDGTDQTITVDDDLKEAVSWVERELREARRALWDGQTGRAYASIEAAQDEFKTVEEAILDD